MKPRCGVLESTARLADGSTVNDLQLLTLLVREQVRRDDVHLDRELEEIEMMEQQEIEELEYLENEAVKTTTTRDEEDEKAARQAMIDEIEQERLDNENRQQPTTSDATASVVPMIQAPIVSRGE